MRRMLVFAATAARRTLRPRRLRMVCAAALGASLLGWATASAVTGPEPVPDVYAGAFVLSYDGQDTAVTNVSGCDLAARSTLVVKPCRFDVPANAGSALKQEIVAALTGSAGLPTHMYRLTHYQGTSSTGITTSDYAVTGDFTISRVTLPVLNPFHASTVGGIGIELKPDTGVDVQYPVVEQVPAEPFNPLTTRFVPFQVGARAVCQTTTVAVKPPAIQISGLTTTNLKSLAMSVDTSGAVKVSTGSVTVPGSVVAAARQWLGNSPPAGLDPTSSTALRTLTVTIGSWNCDTGTLVNQLKLSLPLVATSMEPFPRTDGFFALGVASALGSSAYPATVPTASWK